MKKAGKITFSIIIPFKKLNPYIHQCLHHLKKQSYQNFEIILLPDNQETVKYKKTKVIPTGPFGPAEKRDMGIKSAKAEFLAFIDDDAYPHKDWLKNAHKYFHSEEIAAVCGPGVTPPDDNIFQQAGGWVNSLWFGSGGAGTYRFIPQKSRLVDDFPSMNFIVRKKDFFRAGGFDTHFWPGEDTKLCLDLVFRLNKKILYHPDILVYHHRKPLFLPHMKQISRFALHRGHFARILPKTSLRLGYLIPSFFVIFLLIGFPLSLLFPKFIYFYSAIISIYLVLLTLNILYVTFKTSSILVSVLTGSGIILTHLIYGLLFPVGFFKKSLRQ